MCLGEIMNVDILVHIREGRWLRVFEDRDLKEIFRPERKEKIMMEKIIQYKNFFIREGCDG